MPYGNIHTRTEIFGKHPDDPGQSRAHVTPTGRILTDAALQDQTTPTVILRLNLPLGDFELDGEQTQDAFVLNVVAGHGASAGESICIQEYDPTYDMGRFFQASITAVTATTFTIDRPLDYNFGVGTVLCAFRSTVNIANQVGTIADPIVFTLEPKSGKWDITRIIVQIFTSGTMDDGKFGSIAKLTNGITLRRRNGFVHNLCTIKANGGWSAIAFDVRYADKPPAGTGNGFSCRLTFGGQSKIGVVQRLDASLGDKLELYIPDDLSDFGASDQYIIVAEGHLVQD